MASSDKEYWDAFYLYSQLTSEPSRFAILCAEKYVVPGQVVVEAGCGNGRDAVTLAETGASITAIDQCEQSIAELRKAHGNLSNLKFLADDFVTYAYPKPLDVFYSRFTLHAVGASDKNALLEKVMRALSPGGYLLLEFRGRKNELNGIGRPVHGEVFMYEHEGHKRRFIDSEKVVQQLTDAGMEILVFEEKPGFSPFEGKDETFARVVARSRRN
jgi:ubiquinone/menaquinone biosynthesis C-methylase UbiE